MTDDRKDVSHLVLPKLTRTETQALSILARCGASGRIRIGGEWLAELSPRPFAEKQVPLTSIDTIAAEWAGARMRLSLPQGAIAAWMRATLGADHALPDLPEPLAMAAFESLFEELTAATEKLGRGALHLTRCAQGGAALPHKLMLRLSEEESGEVIHGILEADSLGLMLLSSLVSHNAPARNDMPLASLPMPALLTIGEAALALGDIKGLELHDVIWMSRGAPDGDGGIFVRIRAQGQSPPAAAAECWGFRASLDGSKLTVIEPLKLVKSDVQTMKTDNDQPMELTQIPIRVTFDLGERIFSLEELQTMQPGQVFDLGTPLGRAVAIRANGALIGSGELVDIEGRVGVAVLALSDMTATTTTSDEE